MASRANRMKNVGRVAGILSLGCSALAFGVVMGNIFAGVPPQPDENGSAHLWQLLMIAQLPLILLFLATADWSKRSAALILATQILGIAAAALPVWLAGY